MRSAAATFLGLLAALDEQPHCLRISYEGIPHELCLGGPQ